MYPTAVSYRLVFIASHGLKCAQRASPPFLPRARAGWRPRAACRPPRPYWTWRFEPPCKQARRAALLPLLLLPWPRLSWRMCGVVPAGVEAPPPLRPLPSDGDSNARRRLRRRTWQIILPVFQVSVMMGARTVLGEVDPRYRHHLWFLLSGRRRLHHLSLRFRRARRALNARTAGRCSLQGHSSSSISVHLAMRTWLRIAVVAMTNRFLGAQPAHVLCHRMPMSTGCSCSHRRLEGRARRCGRISSFSNVHRG